ncbi:ComEC family competence protein [Myroides sp. M-43]|uniref:ComEC/Rec2 family competence protein n=1 Tax=Myroides oncorhynchi TaxID=2893756 RepID=UPI001E4F15FB|nr:ComEC/Rec2 family competence protein [Myroides oncorhynchi]MCC9042506.1 ComEC family competence protein [Myroides oncorhynchi]
MKPLKISFLFYSVFLFIGIYIDYPIRYCVAVGIIIILLTVLLGSAVKKFFIYPTLFLFLKDVAVFGILFFFVGISFKGIVEVQHNEVLEKLETYVVEQKKVTVDAVITEIVKTKESKRFLADLVRVNDSLINGKISLYFNSSQYELKVGDVITYYSTIKRITPPKNIGQFDYQKYMKGKEVYVQSYVNEYVFIGTTSNWRSKVLDWRRKLMEKIHAQDSSLHEPSKALLTALLLGEKSFIEDDRISQFKEVGVMHVLAISGLHVGLIYLVLVKVFFFIPRRFRWAVVIVSLWLFVFISGFSPSVFRAVFMFSMFTICKLIGRDQTLEHNIGLALFFSLCIYPYWVYDIGFQLSYLAVISIVYFLPLFKNLYAKNIIMKYIQGILYVSISVQIGLVPLQLYYFHQFSFLFLVANLVVIPLITVLVVLGIVYLMSLGVSFVSVWIGRIFNFFTDIIYLCVEYISRRDYFSFNQVKLSDSLFSTIIGIIVLMTLAYYQKKVRYVVIALLLLVGFQLTILFQEEKTTNIDREVIVPYQSSSRNRMTVWLREGQDLNIISNQWDTVSRSIYDLNKYKDEYAISKSRYHQVEGIIPMQNKTLLILNSDYIDYILPFSTEIVLIAQHPKINFERMLIMNKPELVIFHNSVPFWFKKKCITLCLKNNIPFHDIYEKGYWSSLL